MDKSSKLFIAGHRGLVGSSILRKFQSEGYKNILTRTHAELDLTRQDLVEKFFNNEQPDYVIIAAARVGGIKANMTYPAEFLYENLGIQNNIIWSALKSGAKKLMFLGSSCIYPRECPQPMKEEYLLTGKLEPTNEAYAVAKIGLISSASAIALTFVLAPLIGIEGAATACADHESFLLRDLRSDGPVGWAVLCGVPQQVKAGKVKLFQVLRARRICSRVLSNSVPTTPYQVGYRGKVLAPIENRGRIVAERDLAISPNHGMNRGKFVENLPRKVARGEASHHDSHARTGLHNERGQLDGRFKLLRPVHRKSDHMETSLRHVVHQIETRIRAQAGVHIDNFDRYAVAVRGICNGKQAHRHKRNLGLVGAERVTAPH